MHCSPSIPLLSPVPPPCPPESEAFNADFYGRPILNYTKVKSGSCKQERSARQPSFLRKLLPIKMLWKDTEAALVSWLLLPRLGSVKSTHGLCLLVFSSASAPGHSLLLAPQMGSAFPGTA